MKLFLIVALTVLALANARRDEKVWKSFSGKLRGRLAFDPAKEGEYKERFFEAMDEVENNNNNKSSTFKLAINEYSHLSAQEFVNLRTGYKMPPLPEKPNKWSTGLKGPLPAVVDWHKGGLTTPVKNQGSCGSCYAFAVAAAVEGRAKKLHGIKTDLASQQIVDCSGRDTIYGNYGCEGGFPSAAFDYVRDNRGLTSSASYPYTGKAGPCNRVTPIPGATVQGHKRYLQNSENQLKEILATVGPVVVAIDASSKSLNNYKSGVLTEPKCKGTKMNQLNHAVTLVGYGEEKGVKFWKIKNSWGPQWGEGGYIRINANYDCGVKFDVYAPSW